jgi:hypothetical protein
MPEQERREPTDMGWGCVTAVFFVCAASVAIVAIWKLL